MNRPPCDLEIFHGLSCPCTCLHTVHPVANHAEGCPQLTAVSITLDKGAKMKYVPPKGCDFIPVNPHAGYDAAIGTCVCAPEWGHNATKWDQYKTSAPSL